MGSAKDFAAHTTEQTKNFVAEKTGQAEALAEGLGQAAKPKHKTSRFVRKAGDKCNTPLFAEDSAAHTTEQTKKSVVEKIGQAQAHAEEMGQAAEAKDKPGRSVRQAGDKCSTPLLAEDSAAHTTEQTKNFVAEKTGQAEAHAEGLGQAAKPKHKTSRFVRKAGKKVKEFLFLIPVFIYSCTLCDVEENLSLF
ncbi:hypothetical protein AXG93_4123s1010 [Marchantia polymorpha subsp. ruderalis]|uniref:Uncharacterized protein n=1 Tax=Marchantia polymorpha subsp. ruderalis TaxID=1480154 RepID=A0A176WM55_MARPO|nr:hypothetical protein AXG93_4123s1010 [Marchantia polymorpha subsp. ruderalis]